MEKSQNDELDTMKKSKTQEQIENEFEDRLILQAWKNMLLEGLIN